MNANHKRGVRNAECGANNHASRLTFHVSRFLLSLLLWFCGSSLARPLDASSAFDQANKLYEQDKFAEAAASYEKILQSGQASGALYFNLGNALFKSGQVGRAILNYRRAERLDPRDPAIRANLQFARTTRSGAARPSRWGRWINRLTLNEWTVIADTALWSWFGLLVVGQLRPGFKKSLRGYTATMCVAVVLLGTGLGLAFYDRVHTHWAVVVTPEAVVRYGPFEESQSHYTLRDGAELIVTDSQNDWLEVVDSAGRRGWLRRDQVMSLQAKADPHS